MKNTKCRTFAKIFIKAVTPILYLLHRVKIYGKENLPDGGGFIIASNHIRLLDPFYIAMASDKPIHFMAKSEVFKNPVIGAFFRALNAFPVKRGFFDAESLNFAAQVVKDGDVLGIFPEGGIFPPEKRLGQARPGMASIAHESECDIVPASIYKADTAHFFSKLTIRFGEPIPYSSLELCGKPSMNDYKSASEKVMQKIRELWGEGHEKG